MYIVFHLNVMFQTGASFQTEESVLDLLIIIFSFSIVIYKIKCSKINEIPHMHKFQDCIKYHHKDMEGEKLGKLMFFRRSF